VSARWALAVIVIIGLVIVVALMFASGRSAQEAGQGARPRELIVFHAGSLSVPFRDLSDLFTQRHPNVSVKAEAAGSRDTARKVSDLGRRCDVLGSADYKVVENLLMPEFADFNIRFATNCMGIAYTDASRMADKIGPESWPDVLLEPDVAFGRSDPDSDPCGYRTVMVFQLAERHYGKPGLAARLEEKHGGRFIRPKETDLLALLEAGEIDYMFIYRSVARQHGLRFLELPDDVNLGSAELAEVYAAAQVKVTGKEPGEFLTRIGAPIVYSVTIPKNAPSPDLAEEYVALLLSPEGQRIMDGNGQAPIVPPLTDEYDRLPASLKPFFDRPEE